MFCTLLLSTLNQNHGLLGFYLTIIM